MPAPILRVRLGRQVAEQVEKHLLLGTWERQLPGERVLSAHFGVSRPVLREGLAILKDKGLITVAARRSYSIAASIRKTRAARPAEIHVLSPVPPLSLRLFTNLWLDHLRQHLYDSAYRLVLHHGERYGAKRSSHALGQLAKHHPASAWILIHSTLDTQRWFAESHLPVLVAGSVHPNLILPSVRIDVEAVSRHSAGVLARLGHKHIAFLNLKSNRAGDRASEEAFLQAAHRCGLRAEIIPHGPPAISVDRAVRHLMSRPSRPTGLLIGHAQTYLSVLSSLARLGQRAPDDLSLISREDDPFLNAVLPAPARYVADPKTYAKRIHRTLMAICAGNAKPGSVPPIVPDFLRGASLASFRLEGPARELPEPSNAVRS